MPSRAPCKAACLPAWLYREIERSGAGLFIHENRSARLSRRRTLSSIEAAAHLPFLYRRQQRGAIHELPGRHLQIEPGVRGGDAAAEWRPSPDM